MADFGRFVQCIQQAGFLKSEVEALVEKGCTMQPLLCYFLKPCKQIDAVLFMPSMGRDGV